VLVKKTVVVCLTQPDAGSHFVIRVKGLQQNPTFSLLTTANGKSKFSLPTKYIDLDETDIATYVEHQQSKLKLIRKRKE
jgi:hypothetical protein